MIGYLQGIVAGIEGASVTVLCGGVGYVVQCASKPALQSSVAYHIYTHWHTEQGMQLFGFESAAQRKLFGLILGCPGIGPKIALQLLRELDMGLIVQGITANNPKLLSGVPGIGPKKAESLVLYLKDKIADHMDEFAVYGGAQTTHFADLAQALQVLGYDKHEVGSAMQQVSATATPQESFDSLMRRALASLSRR